MCVKLLRTAMDADWFRISGAKVAFSQLSVWVLLFVSFILSYSQDVVFHALPIDPLLLLFSALNVCRT